MDSRLGPLCQNLGLAQPVSFPYLFFTRYMHEYQEAGLLQPLSPGDADSTVYAAMLADPSAGIDRLSARTGLSEDQAWEVLTALAELGLVRASSEAPGRWEAVSPHARLAAIVEQQEADLTRRQQDINAAKAAVAAVAAAYASPYTAGSFNERLVSLDAIQAQAQHLARSTVAELRVTVPAPMASGDWEIAAVLDDAGGSRCQAQGTLPR